MLLLVLFILVTSQEAFGKFPNQSETASCALRSADSALAAT